MVKVKIRDGSTHYSLHEEASNSEILSYDYGNIYDEVHMSDIV